MPGSNPDPTIPAVGIQAILTEALNAGNLVSGCKLLVGGFEDDPDFQLSIRHNGGLPGELSVAIDYPHIQLMSRGHKGAGSYSSAYHAIAQARRLLIGIPNGGTDYPELTLIKPVGDIQDLGRDDKGRYIFSQNLALIVSYDTSGYRTL